MEKTTIEKTKMSKQDQIRILARKAGVFLTRSLKIFDSKDELTRVLIKHCANEEDLFTTLEQMVGNYDSKDVEVRVAGKDMEITERDLARLYSKTHDPMDHQIRYFQLAKDSKYFANFSEMGLGKTLMTIMEAGYLYDRGEIDSLIVVAPNGVHRQWVNDAIPEHLPDRFNPVCAIWSSSATKAEKEDLNNLVLTKPGKGLKVLTMNVEALGSSSARAYDYLYSFCENHKPMLVIDESTRIKNPKAMRTKLTLKLKELCPYRRILSGLYIPNGPLDLFSQFLFLDKQVLGFNSFVSFRARYAVENNPMLKRDLEIAIGKKDVAERVYNERRRSYVTPDRLKVLLGPDNYDKFPFAWKLLKKSFLIVQGYRNVEELSGKISKYSFRVTKDECLDLAPKTYKSFESKLSPEQSKIYKELESELMSEINGQEVVIDHVLQRLTALRQVCGGTYLDEDGKYTVIGDKVPRLELLVEVLGDIDLVNNKVIIWACHRAEVDMICKRLAKVYGKEALAIIHGDVKGNDREIQFNRFSKDDTCRMLIGTQTSGGIGRNLTAGNYMIFYSNTHDLEIRRQAEDREHRKGQTKNVVIIDFITKGLVDEATLKALLSKQRLADQITKDPLCWKLEVK